ncbi:MAG: hypothetical protein RL254_1627, partial [Planctomycetota bacterium]
SRSTSVSVPTPARASKSIAAHPSAPQPTTNACAPARRACAATPNPGKIICRWWRDCGSGNESDMDTTICKNTEAICKNTEAPSLCLALREISVNQAVEPVITTRSEQTPCWRQPYGACSRGWSLPCLRSSLRPSVPSPGEGASDDHAQSESRR